MIKISIMAKRGYYERQKFIKHNHNRIIDNNLNAINTVAVIII